MNISRTRPQTPVTHPGHSPASDQSDSSPSSAVGDSFQAATRTISEHPLRTLASVTNLASAAATLSTYGSGTINDNFSRGTSALLGLGQVLVGVGRLVDSTAPSYEGMNFGGATPKAQVVSALGDLMSGVGQLALAGGVSTPGAVLLVIGIAASTISDFKS